MPKDKKKRATATAGDNSKEERPAASAEEPASEAQDQNEENPTEPQQPKEKKHDSGAADLEKVTDYAEEKEILPASTDLEDAIATIRNRQVADNAKRLARERELAKVAVRKEDVDLIVDELEISRAKAERTLKEHNGDLIEALAELTN